MPTTKAYLLTKEHVGPATEGTLTRLQAEEVCSRVDLLATGQMGSVQMFTYLPQVGSAVEVYLHFTGQVLSAPEFLLTCHRADLDSDGTAG